MQSNTTLDERVGLLWALFISALTITPSYAQEVCSEGDVQTALQQLPCVADGIYISPASLVADINDDCSDEVTQEECYQCYRRGLKRTVKPFKALVRAGRLPRSFIEGLRTATFNAADSNCALLQDSSGDEDDGLPNQSGADDNRGFLPNPNSDRDDHPRGRQDGERGRGHGR